MAFIGFLYLLIWSLSNMLIIARSLHARTKFIAPTLASFMALLSIFAMVATAMLWQSSDNALAAPVAVVMLILCFGSLLETFELARGTQLYYSTLQARMLLTISILILILGGVLYFA